MNPLAEPDRLADLLDEDHVALLEAARSLARDRPTARRDGDHYVLDGSAARQTPYPSGKQIFRFSLPPPVLRQP